MANQFTQEQLYQSDIYGDLRRSLEKTIEVQKEANKLQKESHDLLNKNAKALNENASDVRQLTAANEKSKKVLNETQKAEASIIKAKGKLKQVTQAQREELARLKLEQAKSNKEAKRAAIVNNKLEDEYEKQSRVLRELKSDYKNLVLAEGKSTNATKKLAKEIGTLDTRLKKVDKNVGEFGRNVGNYPKGLSKATGALKAFAGALGLTAGIAAVVSVFKKAITANIEFEKSLSSLRSITGASTADMRSYSEAAKEIGSSTTLSAKQAVEGFKLIGSAKPELLANKEALIAVTKEAVTLAEAAELELGVAAQSLAGTLNQFNLEADQSSRVINALAAGSKAGAADIPSLNAAIEKTGAVAASMNISLEENIGALETLAEKNIQGAEAGNKLKNVMLIMSTLNALPPAALAQLDKFGVDINKVTDDTLPFQERLEELGKIADDSTALVKVFGKENIVVGQTLLKNSSKVDKYTKAVTGTNTANEQAAINTDNLDGDLKSMGSAWEGVMLSMSAGNGILRQSVQWFTKLLGVLNGSGSIIDIMPDFVSSWTDAFSSFTNFKKAVADTADFFLGWIPGVEELNAALLRETEVVKTLTAEQKHNNEVNRQSVKIGNELIKQNQEEISDIAILIDGLTDENTTREEKDKIITKLQKDYPDYIKNIDLETASTEALIQVKKDLIKQLLTEAIAKKKAEVQAEIFGQILEAELQKTGKNASGVEFLNNKIKDLTAGLLLVDDISLNLEANLSDTIDRMNLESALGNSSDKINELKNAIKGLETELARGDLSQEQRRDLQRRLDGKLEQLARFEQQRIDIIKDGLDETDGLETSADDAANAKKGKKALTAEEIRLQKLAALRKFHAEQLIQIENDLIALGIDKDVREMELFKIRKRQFREEANFIIALNFETDVVLRSTRKDYLAFVEENNNKIKKSDIETIKNQAEVTKNEVGAVLQGAQKVFEENFRLEQEARKKRREQLKKDAKETLKILEESVNLQKDQLNRLIDAKKEEVKASQTEQQRLNAIIKETGDVNATKALVAEKQREAREKAGVEELEKKKRNLQILVLGLQRASQLIEAGDGAPFKNAGSQLTEFLASLPKLSGGTDVNVGQTLGAATKSGTDGHLAWIDKREKLLSIKNSERLGNMHQDDITRGALLYQNQALTGGVAIARPVNTDNRELIRSNEKLIDAVKNIKIRETHIDTEKLMETIIDGNTQTNNHYKKEGLRFD